MIYAMPKIYSYSIFWYINDLVKLADVCFVGFLQFWN